MGDFSGPPFFVFIPFIGFLSIFAIILCAKLWVVFSHGGDWRYFNNDHRMRRRPATGVGAMPCPSHSPRGYFPTFPPNTASPVLYPLYSAHRNASSCQQLSSQSSCQHHRICGNAFNLSDVPPPDYPRPPPYTPYDQYPPLLVLPSMLNSTSHCSVPAKPANDFPTVE